MSLPMRQVTNQTYKQAHAAQARLEKTAHRQTQELATSPLVLVPRGDGFKFALPQSYFDHHEIDFSRFRSDETDRYKSDWSATRRKAVQGSHELLRNPDPRLRATAVFRPRPGKLGGEIALPTDVATVLDEMAGGRPQERPRDEVLSLEDAEASPGGAW